LGATLISQLQRNRIRKLQTSIAPIESQVRDINLFMNVESSHRGFQ